jgi:hypothetical protein
VSYPYLYTPPAWRSVSRIEGSLYVGIPTSTCVYRRGGVWHNVMTAGEADVSAYDVWIDPTGGPSLDLFFTGPTPIPDDGTLVSQLLSHGITPANAAWTDGSLIGPSLGSWVDIGGGVLQEITGTVTDPDNDGVLVLTVLDNGDGTVNL